jgi:hypothetical protein
MLMRILKRVILSLYFEFRALVFGKPDVVLSFGNSLGDDLLCTILAKQLKESGLHRVWIKTMWPELFKYNPFIDRVIPKRDAQKASSKFDDWFLFYFKIDVVKPYYTSRDEITDRDLVPDRHIVEIMWHSLYFLSLLFICLIVKSKWARFSRIKFVYKVQGFHPIITC